MSFMCQMICREQKQKHASPLAGVNDLPFVPASVRGFGYGDVLGISRQ